MFSTHTFLKSTLAILAVLTLLIAGCDFLDPTDVENPRTTDDDLAAAEQPVSALLPGIRAQFTRALGSTVVTSAVATDDYSINGTGLGGNDMDFPGLINPNTAVINSTGASFGSYWNLQELSALTNFVIDDIAPGDESATNTLLAEAHYYRGMGRLMQAENFSAIPTEVGGEPVPASALYTLSLDDLQASLDLDSSGAFALPAEAALARLYRGQGDAGAAASFAQSVLDQDPNFLFSQDYDADNLVNPAHLFIITRALKELQPLPRLDFLDPKYTSRSASIAVAKAEEMHLILAEAALDAGNTGSAQDHLKDARTIALERATAEIDDNDQRLDNDLNPRPRSAEITIAFEPGGDFVEGLVLNRPGVVETPTVSSTSVTEDQIDDAATEIELARLLYLMRQEVLFLEGRRLHDLGMRLPIMLREIEQNPSISPGDLGTETVIPAYIPPSNELDLYTPVDIYASNDVDAALEETEIAILHDMNRILAEDRGLVVSNPQLP